MEENNLPFRERHKLTPFGEEDNLPFREGHKLTPFREKGLIPENYLIRLVAEG